MLFGMKLVLRFSRSRDNPACAQAEYDAIANGSDSGLFAELSFSPNDNVAAPFISTGAKPKIAILREQGVNGQYEMAAAFDRAGFEAHDIHMSDILSGSADLANYKGLAACGGFSYGDVLGAGEGWAKRFSLIRVLMINLLVFFSGLIVFR